MKNKVFGIIDNVYCISLPESIERRKHIEKEFEMFGIKDFCFWDAIGKDHVKVKEAFSENFVVQFPPCFRCGKRICNCENNILTGSQVANFLTYKSVWEDIVKKNYQFCLIIEDDVKFTDYATQVAEQIFKPDFLRKYSIIPQSASLLRLGWAKSQDHKQKKSIQLLPNKLKMSNPCHLITRGMAEKLLSSMDKIYTTSDIYIHKDIGLSVNNYTLFPPLAYELSWSTGEFRSLIHPKQKHIQYLKTKKVSEDLIEKETKIVESNIQKKIIRKLLIVGHPRCGSGYMAKLFQSYGFDIGHELTGKDGISSWMFAVYDTNNPYAFDQYARSRFYWKFDFVIHHVRNPLQAIPSIIVENKNSSLSFQFRRKHIKAQTGIDINSFETEISKAVVSFLKWNEIIDSSNPSLTVKIENCEKDIYNFCIQNKLFNNKLKFLILSKLNARPERNVNSGKRYLNQVVSKPLVDKIDWNQVELSLKKQLNNFCQKYNYSQIYDQETWNFLDQH
jgi:GR25 family glycosyltransferase involved in LPS biosynthesis